MQDLFNSIKFHRQTLTLRTTSFNSPTFHVLPTECIYMSYTSLKTRRDYLPMQHQLARFYNPDGMFTARCKLNLLQKSGQLSFRRTNSTPSSALLQHIHLYFFFSHLSLPHIFFNLTLLFTYLFIYLFVSIFHLHSVRAAYFFFQTALQLTKRFRRPGSINI